MQITILAGAEEDLFQAWRHYEEVLAGLGDRFDESVRAAIKQLIPFPESAPLFAGGFRRLLVRRFEHGIFYRIHGERIVVVAVLDLRQSPETILRRLGI